MRSQYEDFGGSITSDGNSIANRNRNGTAGVPYHARENSLPFSYGQIVRTSTPLKNGTVTSNGYGYGNGGGGGKDIVDAAGRSRVHLQYGSNYNNNSGNNSFENNYSDKSYASLQTNGNDSSMIKPQPRLTSPLLVRKTLIRNQSPTRNSSNYTNTNTIANTYHYNTNKLNGYNYNNYMNNNNNINNNNSTMNRLGNGLNYGPIVDGTGGTGDVTSAGIQRKTQTRNNIEELLRERREKVYNEYQNNRYVDSRNGQLSPVAASRVAHGSDLASLRRSLSPNQNPVGEFGQHSPRKYNYDFEFNFDQIEENLAPTPPRRANTIDRSIVEQYRTRNILDERRVPMGATSTLTSTPTKSNDGYVERNYRTISSSNAIRETLHEHDRERPPLECAYNRRFQPVDYQSFATTNITTTTNNNNNNNNKNNSNNSSATAYGNGNASGYGGDNSYTLNEYNMQHTTNSSYNSHNGDGSGEFRPRNRNGELLSPPSPIYATSSKQQFASGTNNTNTNNNNNNNTTTAATSSSITTKSYRSQATTTEPELSITDYPLATSIPTSQVGRQVNVGYIGNGSGLLASPTTPFASRPNTPAFPVTPRTPYGATNGFNTLPSPSSTNTLGQRIEYNNGHLSDVQNYNSETIYQTNSRARLNSSLSMTNSEPQEVAAHLVKFAKDSSRFWYKPSLSREEAISLLLNAVPGTFVVRDSTTYKNAYGLVLRVAQPPPGGSTGKPDELVRHFLIEPTTRGVRLKGCANEPVFTSLSALVYEHSVNQLALPCLLRIPDHDLVPPLLEPTPAQKQLLTQGAACNVLWLHSCDTESLTGEEAIRKAVRQLYAMKPLPTPTEVYFKVSQEGITLTDNTRKKFFRKHYVADMISYCAIDPDSRQWTMQDVDIDGKTSSTSAVKKTIFAFVARRSPSSNDNQCHVFCDWDTNQQASAIVSFANKTLPTNKQRNYSL